MGAHSAILTEGAETVFDKVAAIANQNGFSVTRAGGHMVIDAPLGVVSFRDLGAKTEVSFEAGSAADLQLLKDLYAQRLRKLGLDDDMRWSKPVAQRPLNHIPCKVESCEKISPNFVRLRLNGDFSAYLGADARLHFRFLFRPENAGWPELDENGLTHWPGGSENWYRPAYTIRRVDPEGRWVDVDIVLHDGGRVTEWCARVQPGEEMVLQGPSGGKRPVTPWQAHFGDETALPVIMRSVEDAPASTTGRIVLALRDPADAQDFPVHSGFELDIVDMADPDALLDALRRLEAPETDRSIFFAAERTQATKARTIFADLGFKPAEAKAAAYWTMEPS